MSIEPMKMLVNANPLLGNMTGVGQVTSEISKRLSANPGLDVDFYTRLKVFQSLDCIEQGSVALWGLQSLKKFFRKLPFKEVLRRRYVELGLPADGYEVYWEPNFIPEPQVQAKKIVTTVHDMAFHEYPEWLPKDRAVFMKENFFQKIDRSDVVVTVSEFSKQRFLEAQNKVREDRVQVIYNGIDHDLFKVYDGELVSHFKNLKALPNSFLLFVGTIEPRKNLSLLLSAYETMPETFKEAFPLVLVGDVGWENKKIFSAMEHQKSHVRWLGYLRSRKELALLYSAASAFIYPSLYEGFGIPPLEAMACGTPVCISSIPVFQEVFGDNSAVYSDPYDQESLSDAIEKLLVDSSLRERLILNGTELSHKYTWDNSYDQYLSLFYNTLC